MKPFETLLATVVVLAAATVTAWAAPYAQGDKIKPLNANDQHGQAWTMDPHATRFLLVSFDMETGKKANAALAAEGKDYLPGKQAFYIANIHGMPGVGRMFALPKMRKYPHRIILGDDANLLTSFPQQAGKVTVVKLDHGTVQAIRYWDPAAGQLAEQLK